MKYARIVNDIAVEVFDREPQGFFHPTLAAQFTAVPQAVVQGSRLAGGVWIAPPPTTPPPPPYVPVQLALIDFLRLFTVSELAGFNAVRKTCAALAAEDYQAAAAGDPIKAALVGFEVFLTYYDALRAGLIELNQPQTVAGLGLLVPLGVLSAERLTDVLAGRSPA